MKSESQHLPLLTVIVGVYNAAAHLQKCLQSLYRQTCKNIEIICIDDGSTDGSLQILREFARRDERIKIIRQKHCGIAQAFNKALKRVQTPFVTFIGGQDYVKADAYKTALKYFSDDVDIVCSNKRITPAEAPIPADDSTKLCGKREIDANIVLQTDYRLGDKLFRTAVIRRYNIRFEHHPYCGDRYFYYCYMAVIRYACFIPDTMYHCRQTEEYIADDYALRCLQTTLPLYKFYVRQDIFRYHKNILLTLLNYYYDAAHKNHPKKADTILAKYIQRMALNQVFPQSRFIWSHYSGIGGEQTIFYFKHWPILVKKSSPSGTSVRFCGLPIWEAKTTPSRQTTRYLLAKLPLFKRSRKPYISKTCPTLSDSKKTRKIKVSVVVPVYNTAEYLPQCLQSLCRQTLKDIEIICINDGSTDDSLQILHEFARRDARIKIINQENKGLSGSRNAGIKRASGEYIGFVDSDDMVSENFYECLYNRAVATSSDIAAANIIRLANGKESIFLDYGRPQFAERLQDKFAVLRVPDFNYVWDRIYVADLLKHEESYFPESVYYEDMVWMPKILLKSGKVTTVPKARYYYRQNANSIMSTTKFSAVKAQHADINMKWEADFLEKYHIHEHLTISKLFNIISLYKVVAGRDYEKHYLLGFIPYKFRRDRIGVKEFGLFNIPLVKISATDDCAGRKYRILGIPFLRRQIK